MPLYFTPYQETEWLKQQGFSSEEFKIDPETGSILRKQRIQPSFSVDSSQNEQLSLNVEKPDLSKPSILGSFGRGAANEAIPSAGSILTGNLAAKAVTPLATRLAPYTRGASLLIPPAVGIGSGILAGLGLSKGQEAILPESVNQTLQQDIQTNPKASLLGRIFAGTPFLRPSFSNLKRAGGTALDIGENLITGGVKGRIPSSDVGNLVNVSLGAGTGLGSAVIPKILAQQPVDPAEAILSTLGGAVFSEPTKLGRKLGLTATEPKIDEQKALQVKQKTGETFEQRATERLKPSEEDVEAFDVAEKDTRPTRFYTEKKVDSEDYITPFKKIPKEHKELFPGFFDEKGKLKQTDEATFREMLDRKLYGEEYETFKNNLEEAKLIKEESDLKRQIDEAKFAHEQNIRTLQNKLEEQIASRKTPKTTEPVKPLQPTKETEFGERVFTTEQLARRQVTTLQDRANTKEANYQLWKKLWKKASIEGDERARVEADKLREKGFAERYTLEEIEKKPQPKFSEIENLPSRTEQLRLTRPKEVEVGSEGIKIKAGKTAFSEEGQGILTADQPQRLKSAEQLESEVKDKESLIPKAGLFDYIKNTFGPLRNIDIQEGVVVDRRTGKEAKGVAITEDGIKQRIARINPFKASLDTLGHEPFHIFGEDLRSSPDRVDRDIMAKFDKAIEESKEFKRINEDRVKRGLQPHSVEEIGTEEFGIEFARRILDPSKMEGTLKQRWQDFLGRLRVKWGKANVNDYKRLLTQRFFKDPNYFETFGKGVTGKPVTEITKTKEPELESEEVKNANTNQPKDEPTYNEEAQLKSSSLRDRIGEQKQMEERSKVKSGHGEGYELKENQKEPSVSKKDGIVYYYEEGEQGLKTPLSIKVEAIQDEINKIPTEDLIKGAEETLQQVKFSVGGSFYKSLQAKEKAILDDLRNNGFRYDTSTQLFYDDLNKTHTLNDLKNSEYTEIRVYAKQLEKVIEDINTKIDFSKPKVPIDFESQFDETFPPLKKLGIKSEFEKETAPQELKVKTLEQRQQEQKYISPDERLPAGYKYIDDPVESYKAIQSHIKDSVVKTPLFHFSRRDFERLSSETLAKRGYSYGIHLGTIEQASDRAFSVYPGAGARTFAVYVKLKNPIRLTDEGANFPRNTVDDLVETDIIDAATANSLEKQIDDAPNKAAEHKVIIDFLKSKGYDGMVYKNKVEGPQGDKRQDAYVVFDDNQLLNAIVQVKTPSGEYYSTGEQGLNSPEKILERIKNTRTSPEFQNESVFKRGVKELTAGRLPIVGSDIDKLELRSGEPGKMLAPALREYFALNREYEGKYLNPSLEALNKLNDKDLDTLYSTMLSEKKTQTDLSNTLDDKQKEAYDILRRIIRQKQEDQIKAGQYVQDITKSGDLEYRLPRIDPFYIPEIAGSKQLNILLNQQGSPAFNNLRKDFINYQKANYDKLSHDEAVKMFDDLLASYGGPVKGDSTHFGAVRRSEGIGLPESWLESDLGVAMRRYWRRVARDRAFYDAVEHDDNLLHILGQKRNTRGQPIKPDKNVLEHAPLAGNKELGNILDIIQGQFIKTNPRLDAATRIASNAVLGPITGITDLINAAPLLAKFIPSAGNIPGFLKAGLNLNQGIKAATRQGIVRENVTAIGDIMSPSDDFTEKLRNVANLVSKVSTREALEKYSRGLSQTLADYLIGVHQGLADAGNKRSIDLLKGLANNKDYTKLSKEQLASRLVELTQGTYDPRGLPSWAIDSQIAPFFRLAKWNIEQLNNLHKHVLLPATKGNLTPLLMTIAGGTLGGYLAKEVRERLNNKKQPYPEFKEILASSKGLKGNLPDATYNLAAAISYSGVTGILGDVIKSGFDVSFKNTPQGFNFPLMEITSDTAVKISQAADAIAKGENPINVTKQLVEDIASNHIQIGRIAKNQLASRTYDKQKFKDVESRRNLRTYRMVENQPFQAQGISADFENPYVGIESKKFKRRTISELPTAIREAKTLVKDAAKTGDIEQFKKKATALKRMPVLTIPSPTSDPTGFARFVNYNNKVRGKEDTKERVSNYFRQKQANKIKASFIP